MMFCNEDSIPVSTGYIWISLNEICNAFKDVRQRRRVGLQPEDKILKILNITSNCGRSCLILRYINWFLLGIE